jgi:hypothetical protein
MSDTTAPDTRFVSVQVNQFRGLVTWCRKAREKFDAIENLHATRPAENGVEYCISCKCPGPCATICALGRQDAVRTRYARRTRPAYAALTR